MREIKMLYKCGSTTRYSLLSYGDQGEMEMCKQQSETFKRHLPPISIVIIWAADRLKRYGRLWALDWAWKYFLGQSIGIDKHENCRCHSYGWVACRRCKLFLRSIDRYWQDQIISDKIDFYHANCWSYSYLNP